MGGRCSRLRRTFYSASLRHHLSENITVPTYTCTKVSLQLTKKLALRPRPMRPVSVGFLALAAILFLFGASSSSAFAER